jgi:hypothetical protein
MGNAGSSMTRSWGRRLRRLVRATDAVVRDGRIPRPIRWGGAIGLMPVPGPFDEVVLLVVGGVLWLFYRDQLRDAWRGAADVELVSSPTRGASL